MSWIRVAILLGIATIIGCSDGQEVQPPKESSTEKVTKMLEGIAKTGSGGSEIGAVMNELQKLHETDPALAEDLRKDAQAFMSTQLSSDQLKAKAQEMLDKLKAAKGG